MTLRMWPICVTTEGVGGSRQQAGDNSHRGDGVPPQRGGHVEPHQQRREAPGRSCPRRVPRGEPLTRTAVVRETLERQQ